MGDDPGNLVLYTSKDSINWDSGVILHIGTGGADSYSANLAIGNCGDNNPNKLLIQSSIAYDDRKVNIRQWWIENIHGAGR